MNGQTDGWMDD